MRAQGRAVTGTVHIDQAPQRISPSLPSVNAWSNVSTPVWQANLDPLEAIRGSHIT
jgi:hypothetical protein